MLPELIAGMAIDFADSLLLAYVRQLQKVLVNNSSQTLKSAICELGPTAWTTYLMEGYSLPAEECITSDICSGPFCMMYS